MGHSCQNCGRCLENCSEPHVSPSSNHSIPKTKILDDSTPQQLPKTDTTSKTPNFDQIKKQSQTEAMTAAKKIAETTYLSTP